jgi:hypothetical protein
MSCTCSHRFGHFSHCASLSADERMQARTPEVNIISAILDARRAGVHLPTVIEAFLAAVKETDPDSRIRIKVT